MSLLLIKSILAVVFLAAASTAAWAQLTLLGKMSQTTAPDVLKKIHKTAGYTGILILLVLIVLGADVLADTGDGLSTRAVFHYTLAFGLIAVLMLKVLVVRSFRGFLRIVPTLGMAVFLLSLVIVLGSAGYYALRGGNVPSPESEASAAAIQQTPLQGNAETGSRIFAARCAGCHFPDREDPKSGPGLKGLFRRSSLPVSGRPITIDTVLRQLKSPFKSMPAVTGLAEQDLADLLAYLQIL